MTGRWRGARKVVDLAVEVVGERAQWLTEQAVRVVGETLQRGDPTGVVQATESRLDGVREGLIAMSVQGRLDRAAVRRMQRDLGRSRQELARVRASVPPVRAAALARRIEVYGGVLGGTGTSPGVAPAWGVLERAALAGAGVGSSAVIFFAAGPPLVEGGLLAGSAGAVAYAVTRRRQAVRERLDGIVAAMTEADRAVRVSDGETVHDLRDLDAARRDLVRRTLASERLEEAGAQSLRRIDGALDDLLLRLVSGELTVEASYVVQATITRYLPDTLEPFLAVEDPKAMVGGRPVALEVGQQLASIEGGLGAAARGSGRLAPEDRLRLQGEFLRDRFGPPAE